MQLGEVNDSGRRLRALLIGAGSLGRAFLRRLRDDHVPVDLVGVLTAHHGRISSGQGLDPTFILNSVEADSLKEDGSSDLKKLIDDLRPDVVLDCIPQNIRSGEPSLGLLRTALDAGTHVITANKAAVALGYRDLRHRAAKQNVVFRFEATVLDGLPVFSMLSHVAGAEVIRVRGVLNGTSSLVFESVQFGSTRSRGLARAQAQGIAEADAVLDLDGWDAAAKAALLANVWMGGALRIVDVARKGCDTIKDERLREAADAVHYRLVAEALRSTDGIVRASVEPVALEPGDPFYALRGAAGGLLIELKGGHAITVLQTSHGLDEASYGLVQDCYAILRGDPQV